MVRAAESAPEEAAGSSSGPERLVLEGNDDEATSACARDAEIHASGMQTHSIAGLALVALCTQLPTINERSADIFQCLAVVGMAG